MEESKATRMTCEEIAYYTWNEKYRNGEETIDETSRRTAAFAATNDPDWLEQFHRVISRKLFIPAGRILSNAGTNRPKSTMSNCYFLDTIPDTMDGIFSLLHESALIMQAGGGIGMDFSGLRPKGAPVKGTGSVSSGPVSFAQVWDAMCKTIEAAGSRRGAQMGIMRVDHPDIDLFINAKKKDALGENGLTMFNLSVAVTDDFMDAVHKDLEWKLTHNGKVYKTVKAAELWDRIMTSNYYDWEPGILFIDRINKMNPLWYAETITGTNPCGEQPLPPYNSCNLGSFALPNFVTNPFTGLSTFDFLKFEETVNTAVRFMDNILDLNYYPLEKIREQSLATRRIGLGITGLTDTLSMLGLRYGSEEGVELSQRIMQNLRDAAYRASVDLSKERGAFPKFERDKHLSGAFIKALPDQIQQGIYRHGIRNSHLITIAPTGTTSLFCGNLSSGVEPYFGIDYERSIRTGKGEAKISIESSHYSIELYRNSNGNGTGPLPDCILANVASNIGYKDHLRMQGMLQQFVDASISKTINFPEDVSYEEFKEAYMTAYDLGCKGCTTYRPNKGRHGIIKEKSAQGNGLTVSELPDVPDTLDARRYKVKPPEHRHAYYINISDIEENGKKRPFEIFINTKDPNVSEWTTALTRTISSIFRRTKDPSFIAEELMEIQNQRTGFWHPKRRKHVPSLVAEIGETIRDHLVHLGMDDTVPIEVYDQAMPHNGDKPKYGYCARCGKDTLVRQEGCEFCLNPKCNYDRCG